ncbi:MAG: ceramidase domain-containing protein [Hyphomicrobiaceae bacterium]
MSWTDKIFNYCERGGDAGFWAEPVNALTNGAFLVAAALALVHLARSDQPRTSDRVVAMLLAVLVGIIGIGSFLFHTYAERWSALADTAPIGLFMFVYLAVALRTFLRLPYVLVALGLGLFYLASAYALRLRCEGGPCLNGSVGYLPAFGAMLLVGVLALPLRVRGAGLLPVAALVFALSLAARTLDLAHCPQLVVGGYRLGSHFLWHLMNALTLYLLLLARIRASERVAGRADDPIASPGGSSR